MAKIFVLGTSHIARESIEKIKAAFQKHKPDIIAVELDNQRLFALMHKQKTELGLKNLFRLGMTSYLFLLVGSFVQKKLGQMTGLAPGADMLYASKLALKNKKMLLLIDRDINVTLRRFSKKFSAKEKFRIFTEVLFGGFSKRRMAIRLDKIPEEELIEKMLEFAKDRFPNAYEVLIGERNEFMAEKLLQAHKAHPEASVLAVVGAGHKKGIIQLLKQKLE